MARAENHFEFADRGATSVYKFRVMDDPTHYVWFEYDDGTGGLFTTPNPGPYRAEDPLDEAEFDDLDSLLAARRTSKRVWIEDLMAQFGERLAWAYP